MTLVSLDVATSGLCGFRWAQATDHRRFGFSVSVCVHHMRRGEPLQRTEPHTERRVIRSRETVLKSTQSQRCVRSELHCAHGATRSDVCRQPAVAGAKVHMAVLRFLRGDQWDGL